MKVATSALTLLALSTEAFQPGRPLHHPTRLGGSSPFAQIAQMLEKAPLNGVKSAVEEAAAESGGPGCIRKANFDDEEAKVTYANQSDLLKALGIPAEVTGAAVAPKPAAEKVEETTVAAEERPPSPNERIYGVVNTKKLNKLYDLVVIGGGPAGVAGAIKAAQMGRRAILIDKVCVHLLLLTFACFVDRCHSDLFHLATTSPNSMRVCFQMVWTYSLVGPLVYTPRL